MSLQKELKILVFLFLFLAIAMHFGAWIDHPLAQIKALPTSPLGIWHPLFLTLIAYVVIVIIRSLFSFLKRLLLTQK